MSALGLARRVADEPRRCCAICRQPLSRFSPVRARTHVACEFTEDEQDALLRLVREGGFPVIRIARDLAMPVSRVSKGVDLAMKRRGYKR